MRAVTYWRVFAFYVVAGLLVTVSGQTTKTDGLTINSIGLGEERSVLVRTPAGYAENNERYPVVYVTDGRVNLEQTAGVIAYLSLIGRMPKMIVVGLSHPNRVTDLTPTQVADSRNSGGADKFLMFVKDEVVPTVERRYRTQPFRILAGHSLGGLFAIHAMLKEPDLFNAYIAASPALQWDQQFILKNAESFFQRHKQFKKKLYFALGNEPSYSPGFERFKQFLTEGNTEGFVWKAEQFTDEDHGSIVLRAYEKGLMNVFSDWQAPANLFQGPPDELLGKAKEFYTQLSGKYGYAIAIPEGVVNGIGYRLLAEKNTEQAIALFKMNVQTHPNSANAWDSLAEAYEKSGRLKEAEQNYRKAYLLGKSNNNGQASGFKINLDRVAAKRKGSNN